MSYLQRLPWPLPAFLSWGLCWLALSLLLRAGLTTTDALAASTLLGVLLSLMGATWWRRLFIGLGYPLSLLLLGGLSIPPWGWLLPGPAGADLSTQCLARCAVVSHTARGAR